MAGYPCDERLTGDELRPMVSHREKAELEDSGAGDSKSRSRGRGGIPRERLRVFQARMYQGRIFL